MDMPQSWSKPAVGGVVAVAIGFLFLAAAARATEPPAVPRRLPPPAAPLRDLVAKLPADRRARLLEAFRTAHASDRFQERARSQGTDPTWRGPEEFGAMIAREMTAFAQVAQQLGIERPR